MDSFKLIDFLFSFLLICFSATNDIDFFELTRNVFFLITSYYIREISITGPTFYHYSV